MILDYQVEAELEEINTWISSGKTIMEDWGLSRFLKAGYRSCSMALPVRERHWRQPCWARRTGWTCTA